MGEEATLICRNCGMQAEPGETVCAYCNEELLPAQTPLTKLRLEKIGSTEEIEITPPGGWLGKDNTYSLPSLANSVSYEHIYVSVNEKDQWTMRLEGETGAKLRTSEKIEDMRKGVEMPVRDRQFLVIPRSNFKIHIEPYDPNENDCASPAPEIASGCTLCEEDNRILAIICPRCGKTFPVDSEDARIKECDHCIDFMDKYQIANQKPVWVSQ